VIDESGIGTKILEVPIDNLYRQSAGIRKSPDLSLGPIHRIIDHFEHCKDLQNDKPHFRRRSLQARALLAN
jgi:hypothetical protein